MSANLVKASFRSRAPNFTTEEQLLLCKIAETYSNIIESKKTDGVKQNQKKEAWIKIQEVYNSNTKGTPRSVENLLSCYRNMKSKIKKQRSGAKMVLKDPTKKKALIDALEENGTDWNAVSLEIQETAEVCESSFIELEKDCNRKEKQYKKSIMGTGGGPPPPPADDDALISIKKIIAPQVDGLYTIYDGDADLMEQYQESLPDSEKIKPIEFEYQNEIPQLELELIHNEKMEIDDLVKTPTKEVINRVDLLRKKTATPLNSSRKCEKSNKKTCNDRFQMLAEAKAELVGLQTRLTSMEIEHKKAMQEMEIKDMVKEYEFKEKMREKQLILLDLKIKKVSE